MSSQPANEVFNWTLRRAGAGITVTGKSKDGSDVKIANICEVSVWGSGSVLATAMNGSIYVLCNKSCCQEQIS